MPSEEIIVCVKCTSVLDRKEIAGIEVDICPSCGGVWLDRGELEKLGEKSDAELDEMRSALGIDKNVPPVPSDTTTACPVCQGTLKEVQFGNILIDYCGSCKGLWLDKGEFDAAVKLVKEKGLPVESILVLAGQIAG